MSPVVQAAVIAAGVGIVTVIGAIYGTRKTSKDTKDALNQQLTEQGKQLDKTLAEQREQLDKTLKAQSDQLDRTLTEQHTRTLNERFATAADQLGSDKPAVRLAGVYAMAGLADDWKENRQTCVDVLCAYLRMTYEPDPGQDTSQQRRLAFQAIREVRHTVIRVITAHLTADAAVSWQGLNFDFTGVVFDGGDFFGAQFSGGTVNFSDAQFSGGEVTFAAAKFSGGKVYFTRAQFSGAAVDFGIAQFTGDGVYFNHAQFSGGHVEFFYSQFTGGKVDFDGAQFSGGTVNFKGARFSGSTVNFGAQLSGGAQFSGGTVSFKDAQFSGGQVNFKGAQFSGGTVDFSDAGDWSFPPEFPWTDAPPSGVKLPAKQDQSEA